MRRRKPSQAEHIAVLGAADDHRPARAGLEQSDATQDQRAHDPLAQFGLGHEQCPKPVRRNKQGLHRPLRVSVHEGGSSRELRQFAHEGAGLVRDDRHAAAGWIVLGDVDLAVQDDGQAETLIADLGQRFAGTKRMDVTKPAHAFDLRRLKGGEHLVRAGIDDRWGQGSHNALYRANSAYGQSRLREHAQTGHDLWRSFVGLRNLLLHGFSRNRLRETELHAIGVGAEFRVGKGVGQSLA